MNKIYQFLMSLFNSKIKEEVKEAVRDFQDSKPINENMTSSVLALETTPTIITETKSETPKIQHNKPKKKKKQKPKVSTEQTQLKTK